MRNVSAISAHNSGTHRVQNGCKKCVPGMVHLFDGNLEKRCARKEKSLVFDLFKALFRYRAL